VPTPRRFLIVRRSDFGDIAQALPLLAAIRRSVPGAFIGWLCSAPVACLLRGHPMLDALHLGPACGFKGFSMHKQVALVRELRVMQYEYALDLQGDAASACWIASAGIKRRARLAPSGERLWSDRLFTNRVEPNPRLHVIERYLQLLQPVGLNAPQPEFPVHLPNEARLRAEQIVGEEAGLPLIVVNPGAGSPVKRWPTRRFGELAARFLECLPCRIAVAWGPGEERLAAEVLSTAGARFDDETNQKLPPTPGLHSLPRTSFPELLAIIERAALFVGCDSGPTHFAAAIGTPTIAVMGSLDGRFYGPYGEEAAYVQFGIPKPPPRKADLRSWHDTGSDIARLRVEDVLKMCLQMPPFRDSKSENPRAGHADRIRAPTAP